MDNYSYPWITVKPAEKKEGGLDTRLRSSSISGLLHNDRSVLPGLTAFETVQVNTGAYPTAVQV